MRTSKCRRPAGKHGARNVVWAGIQVKSNYVFQEMSHFLGIESRAEN